MALRSGSRAGCKVSVPAMRRRFNADTADDFPLISLSTRAAGRKEPLRHCLLPAYPCLSTLLHPPHPLHPRPPPPPCLRRLLLESTSATPGARHDSSVAQQHATMAFAKRIRQRFRQCPGLTQCPDALRARGTPYNSLWIQTSGVIGSRRPFRPLQHHVADRCAHSDHLSGNRACPRPLRLFSFSR